MLPSIPPTTLHDMARDYRGVPRDTTRHFTTLNLPPAKRRLRELFTANPLGALTQRIEAWLAARGERRYGTRIVSRPASHRPDRLPVAITQRAPGELRDRDLAA